jgi:glycosyltransferase involved in cell wall biosynthesis
MEGFEKNLAHALTNYLELTEQERRECREIVRRNAAEHLSWDNLAERLTDIAGGG